MNTEQIREQVEHLLRSHMHPSTDPEPLHTVMQSCRFQHYAPGEVLCAEGAPGDALFFVLSGTLRVTRVDRQGNHRELAFISAPALIGHMGIIDRSPRAATCTVAERAYVGTLDEQTCKRFMANSGPEGTAFRRLLLSSLQRQLQQGICRLRDLLSPDFDEPPTSEVAAQTLSETSATLSGWSSLNTDTSWREEAFEMARSLPLSAGARIVVELDRKNKSPFSLEMDGFEPEQSKHHINRFVRFLSSIPTPPQARIHFRSCPSDIVTRPQVVTNQMTVYFPRKSFEIAGSEQDIQIDFQLPDTRWSSFRFGS